MRICFLPFSNIKRNIAYSYFLNTILSWTALISISPQGITRNPCSSIFALRRSYPQPSPNPTSNRKAVLVVQFCHWPGFWNMRIRAGHMQPLWPPNLRTRLTSDKRASVPGATWRTWFITTKSNFSVQSVGRFSPIVHEKWTFFTPSACLSTFAWSINWWLVHIYAIHRARWI